MTVPIKGGAPAKYNSPKEMEKIIDDYFASCWEEHWKKREIRDESSELTDTVWEQQLDKDGNPTMILKDRPTVTGLALALGFNSRQTLMNYQVKKEYMDTIKKAKTLIEHYYEKGVVEGDIHPATGIFILKNFEWKDTFEVNTNNQPEQLHADDVKNLLKDRNKE